MSISWRRISPLSIYVPHSERSHAKPKVHGAVLPVLCFSAGRATWRSSLRPIESSLGPSKLILGEHLLSTISSRSLFPCLVFLFGLLSSPAGRLGRVSRDVIEGEQSVWTAAFDGATSDPHQYILRSSLDTGSRVSRRRFFVWGRIMAHASYSLCR